MKEWLRKFYNEILRIELIPMNGTKELFIQFPNQEIGI